MRLYLSPSNQPKNLYAVGNTNEKEQMEQVALLVQEKLKSYEIDTIMADFNKGISKNQRPADARNSKCDFYLAIHSNATGSVNTAVGAVGLYHPNSEVSKKLSLVLVEELDKICPYKSNRFSTQINGLTGNKGSYYGEIKHPFDLGIPSTLIEVNFHDNPTVARWIIDNKDLIADAIVKGLVKVFDLKKKEVKEEVKEEVVQAVEEKYNTIDEIPSWGKETVAKLVEKGYIQGTGQGLDLTKNMLRLLVINDRAGLYNK